MDSLDAVETGPIALQESRKPAQHRLHSREGSLITLRCRCFSILDNPIVGPRTTPDKERR